MVKYKELLEYEELIRFIIDFYLSKIINPTLFEDIKIKLENHPFFNREPNHNVCIILGEFSRDDFIIYAQETKFKGVRLNSFIVHNTIDLLSQNLIISEKQPWIPYFNTTRYVINEVWALYLYKNNLILNCLFGFDYIINKYKEAVIKIENIYKDEYDIGTGFLIKYRKEGYPNLYNLIITNKHVVEKYDKITLYNVDNELITYNKIYLNETSDLAIILLDTNLPFEGFSPNTNLNLLEDIITMGYPSIPLTKEAYQVVHKGEINSFVENYWGHKLFLFSAKTSSGNSGSPIIDKTGRFLGIVTEELFEKESFEKKGKLPYYAGIPATEIIEFCNMIVLNLDS